MGPLRFPVFGVIATAGMLAALALSQRSARRAGVPPERLWDGGVVGIVLAFALSRIELVLSNWRAFRAMPMLVLSLPSISYTGLLLTLLLVLFYLRRRGVPVLRAMDAWAPCAMLLWAFVSLGHFIEGTDAGLPTTMPWGVVSAGDTVLGKTQPVQLYEVATALQLMAFLYRRVSGRRGEASGLGLLCGGGASFLLDFLRQPVLGYDVDPSQYVAVMLCVAGAAILVSQPAVREEAAAASGPPLPTVN